MMLEERGVPDILSHLEKVVAEAVHQGITTPDLGGG
jgi:isocitrate dehydrogenase